MKTLTLVQAAALLMLAVFGAYAGGDTGSSACSKGGPAMEACDL